MVDYKHLELPSLMSSDGDFLRAPQTLFVQPAPAFSVHSMQQTCDARRDSCEPLHSWFQHAEDTSFWRRSHVRTFYCRILGS